MGWEMGEGRGKEGERKEGERKDVLVRSLP